MLSQLLFVLMYPGYRLCYHIREKTLLTYTWILDNSHDVIIPHAYPPQVEPMTHSILLHLLQAIWDGLDYLILHYEHIIRPHEAHLWILPIYHGRIWKKAARRKYLPEQIQSTEWFH